MGWDFFFLWQNTLSRSTSLRSCDLSVIFYEFNLFAKVHQNHCIKCEGTMSFWNARFGALSRSQVEHSDGFRCFPTPSEFSIRFYWAPNKMFLHDSFSPPKHVALLLWIWFAHAYKYRQSFPFRNNSQWSRRWEHAGEGCFELFNTPMPVFKFMTLALNIWSHYKVSPFMIKAFFVEN